MRRFAAILVSLSLLALGTGTLEYVHNLAHAAEDAREDALVARESASTATPRPSPALPHQHDESNCDVHAQLHLALFLGGWAPAVVCLGLFVAFLTRLDTPLIPRLLPARIDCRGPPASRSSR